jgi:hypothetical protein
MAYELTGTDISVDPMHDRLRSLKGPCEWCHGNRRPVGRLRCQLQQLPPAGPIKETAPERLEIWPKSALVYLREVYLDKRKRRRSEYAGSTLRPIRLVGG